MLIYRKQTSGVVNNYYMYILLCLYEFCFVVDITSMQKNVMFCDSQQHNHSAPETTCKHNYCLLMVKLIATHLRTCTFNLTPQQHTSGKAHTLRGLGTSTLQHLAVVRSETAPQIAIKLDLQHNRHTHSYIHTSTRILSYNTSTSVCDDHYHACTFAWDKLCALFTPH